LKPDGLEFNCSTYCVTVNKQINFSDLVSSSVKWVRKM
jgi:hypothetical protein